MNLKSKSDREIHALRMRWLRRHYDKTMQECADALGVNVSSYAGIEANGIKFRRRDLVTLADLYGLPLDEAFPVREHACAE